MMTNSARVLLSIACFVGVVLLFFTSASPRHQVVASEIELLGDAVIKQYIQERYPPATSSVIEQAASLRRSLPHGASAAVCPYNATNLTQYAALLTEIVYFMGLQNYSSRCAYWPTVNPCVPTFISSISGSTEAAAVAKMNATFQLYYTFCATFDKIECFTVVDGLSDRQSCFSQVPTKAGACTSSACMVAVGGTSCIPKASPQFFSSYCTTCFGRIRSALISFYSVVSANATDSSTSASAASDSGSGSSGDNTKTQPGFGIVLSEAGFAAVDARVSSLCGNECPQLNKLFATSDAYEETLSRLLFDFSAGAPNYLVGTNASVMTALSHFVCAPAVLDPSRANLRCFRRFISSWLDSNHALVPFLRKSCLTGRKASAATCDLEVKTLDDRLAWWVSELGSSDIMLCRQSGYSGAAPAVGNCLGVPSATGSDPSASPCFQQAYSPGNDSLTPACFTTVTQSMTSWGCCVQALVDPAAPMLNPKIHDWARDFIETQILYPVANHSMLSGCVKNPSLQFNATFLSYVGLRLTTLPYAVAENNGTLFNLLADAIIYDVAAAIGVSVMNFGSFQLTNFVVSGNDQQSQQIQQQQQAAFFSSASSSVNDKSVADQTAIIIAFQAESAYEGQYIVSSFNYWVSSANPSSPAINTLLTNAGFGPTELGSSSVAYYAPPATNAPNTLPPDTPVPSGPAVVPPGSSPNSDGKGGLVAGAVIAGILGVGSLIFILVRINRKRRNGETQTGEYLEVQ